MQKSKLRLLAPNPTRVAAILGGTLALVLLIGQGGVGVSGAFDNLDLVFAGSLLAGFLARRYGGTSLPAGIGAAVLAFLPSFLSLSEPVGYFFQTYGVMGSGKAAATVMLFSGLIILITALIGSLGGGIGGWVGKRFPATTAT